MNKSVLLSFLFLYVNMFVYVPTTRSPPLTRPEPLVRHLQIDVSSIVTPILLCMCVIVLILPNIDLNCRFISFNTRLNTLSASKRTSLTDNLFLLLLFLSYLAIFEYYFLIFVPYEFFKVHFDSHYAVKQSFGLVKLFHSSIANIALRACYRLTCLVYLVIVCFCHYPYEILALWFLLLRLILCPDINPNPGPVHLNNFSGGFLSFCNWNLNTLSKDEFSRITLLEAHNAEYNYDIISLCETSLSDAVRVPENALPGYKFYSCDHPDGERSGGVGIFYKETLPLRIRPDLSFDECVVSEMIFGHKKIFFTVLYRNPRAKAHSDEFNSFLENFENLYEKIKNEKPYATFFTGDFNGHSQSWYPQGDSNPEGFHLDNLFQALI